MDILLPNSLPNPHREFLGRAIDTLSREPWLVGIVATGSLAQDSMDEFSDLDLVIAVEDAEHSTVMGNRVAVAESLGPLLSAFTGEHVGQPQLLLCLYGPHLLHADLQFESLSGFARRSDDRMILWERDGRLSSVLNSSSGPIAAPEPQWIEDRFWVWVHKAAGKIGRGEFFAALEYLAFFRSRILGPLGLQAVGQPAVGVQKIEFLAPLTAVELKGTVASYDASECLQALRACVEIYRRLRPPETDALQYRRSAENAVTVYLKEIEVRIRRQMP